MKPIKVIFLPGNGYSLPTDNWFPYLKSHLEAIGCEVIAREFPDGGLARESYWIPFLKELGPDERTILVGHSSGAICAMRYAETDRLLGSVLVAAYATDLGYENEKLSGYFDRPWNWKAITANQEWIVQFAAQDDPWIPISEPREVHQQLQTEYFEFPTGGHFGGDYHKPDFPQLLEAIKKKIAK